MVPVSFFFFSIRLYSGPPVIMGSSLECYYTTCCATCNHLGWWWVCRFWCKGCLLQRIPCWVVRSRCMDDTSCLIHGRLFWQIRVSLLDAALVSTTNLVFHVRTCTCTVTWKCWQSMCNRGDMLTMFRRENSVQSRASQWQYCLLELWPFWLSSAPSMVKNHKNSLGLYYKKYLSFFLQVAWQ